MSNYPSDGRTTVTAGLTPRTFSATITGPKAEHMSGGVSSKYDEYGWSDKERRSHGVEYLPQRRFWYLNTGLVGMATDSIVNRIMLDWQNNDRNVVRTGYFQVANMQGVIRRGK
jgi:hypothetical protein